VSAVIAVLVVLAAALVAGLSTQVNQGLPNYAAEQPSSVAGSDEIASDDKPEQKRSHKQADQHSVKREQKQNEPACVQHCSSKWPRYDLTPWPL
jgi:hypothetical protein